MSFRSLLGLADASDIRTLLKELQTAKEERASFHAQEMETAQSAAETVSALSGEIAQVGAGLNDLPGIIQGNQEAAYQKISKKKSALSEQMEGLRLHLMEYTNLEQANADKLLHAMEANQLRMQERFTELRMRFAETERELQAVTAMLEGINEMLSSIIVEQTQEGKALQDVSRGQEKVFDALKKAQSSQEKSFSTLEETRRFIADILQGTKDYLNLLWEASKLKWVDKLLETLE